MSHNSNQDTLDILQKDDYANDSFDFIILFSLFPTNFNLFLHFSIFNS